jgi:hypothetical protein
MIVQKGIITFKMTDKLTLTEILKKPNPSEVVNTLLTLEKENKKDKIKYNFEQLIGHWRFITGTKKVRKKGGVILGSGKYLPNFTQINLIYNQDFRVENKVKFGFLELILTGPVKFLPATNILAFDFTQIQVKLGSKNIYSGYIRNGAENEQKFNQESIKKQAFFNYFLIQNDLIAARGKGGGLAIWIKK